jgi:dCTP deaminase
MSTLSDVDIAYEIKNKRLILNASTNGPEGACYELRMGSVYYDLTEQGKRFALSPGERALIKPGHRVVLITAEEFDVPSDVLVRVVSKGSLFSVGLSPVATYADPGFKGNLGIVTENISDKYIELPQGEPIAKADFTRLSGPAAKTYHGQHGFQAGIWPIKTQLQKSHAELKGDPRVKSERDEALALLPPATRIIIRRIELSQAWINGALAVAMLVNAGALFAIGRGWIDAFHAILTNLVSSAIVGILTFFVTYSRRT